jgi:hypothetical protein
VLLTGYTIFKDNNDNDIKDVFEARVVRSPTQIRIGGSYKHVHKVVQIDWLHRPLQLRDWAYISVTPSHNFSKDDDITHKISTNPKLSCTMYIHSPPTVDPNTRRTSTHHVQTLSIYDLSISKHDIPYRVIKNPKEGNVMIGQVPKGGTRSNTFDKTDKRVKIKNMTRIIYVSGKTQYVKMNKHYVKLDTVK